MGPFIRRTAPADARAVSPLVLLAAPSLAAVLGDSGTALRGIEACYRAERTEFAHRFGLLAESDGEIVGAVFAFPGRLYQSLKLGTGVTLARSAGAAHVTQVVRRERVLSRLLPGVDRDRLYVSIVAVAEKRRRRGIGRSLLERVLQGADRLGLAVALDTAMRGRTTAFYEGLGFRVVSARETTTSERKVIPVEGVVRMERPLVR